MAKNRARTAKHPITIPTIIPAVMLLSFDGAAEDVTEGNEVEVGIGVVLVVAWLVDGLPTIAAAFRFMKKVCVSESEADEAINVIVSAEALAVAGGVPSSWHLLAS